MKIKKIMKEETRKEFNDWLRRHGFPRGEPKGQREWDSVTRSLRASKKAGEPRYKYEDIVDYDGEEWIVKGSWVREDKGENEYKLTNMDGTESIYVLQSEIENPKHEMNEAKEFDEGLEEDVLAMADREDELVWMIQDTFWHLADLGDPDILRELIENCVELEKVKPGRLKEIISDEV